MSCPLVNTHSLVVLSGAALCSVGTTVHVDWTVLQPLNLCEHLGLQQKLPERQLL